MPLGHLLAVGSPGALQQAPPPPLQGQTFETPLAPILTLTTSFLNLSFIHNPYMMYLYPCLCRAFAVSLSNYLSIYLLCRYGYVLLHSALLCVGSRGLVRCCMLGWFLVLVVLFVSRLCTEPSSRSKDRTSCGSFGRGFTPPWP
jgi:hypothetical protein